jgi:hypothetical protein
LGTLAAQLFHACPDYREIVGGAGSGRAAQFFHTGTDCLEVVGGAGGHISLHVVRG